MHAVSAARSTDGWASADIVDSQAGHDATIELARVATIVPGGVSLLLGAFAAFGSGLSRRLRLSLGQLLEDGINQLQFAPFAHRNQQLCVFVKTDRGRILFAEHLPAGLNCRGDVLDFISLEVGSELIEAAFRFSYRRLEMLEPPNRVIIYFARRLKTVTGIVGPA